MHHISPVSQPQGSNLCWAAVIGMLIGRTSQSDIQGIVQRMQTRAGNLVLADGTLATHAIPTIASAYGFRFFPIGLDRDLDLELLKSCLSHSACGVFGIFDYDEGQQLRHAIVINGLNIGFGGSESGTTIYYVDPYDGVQVNMTFIRFEDTVHADYIIFR